MCRCSSTLPSSSLSFLILLPSRCRADRVLLGDESVVSGWLIGGFGCYAGKTNPSSWANRAQPGGYFWYALQMEGIFGPHTTTSGSVRSQRCLAPLCRPHSRGLPGMFPVRHVWVILSCKLHVTPNPPAQAVNERGFPIITNKQPPPTGVCKPPPVYDKHALSCTTSFSTPSLSHTHTLAARSSPCVSPPHPPPKSLTPSISSPANPLPFKHQRLILHTEFLSVPFPTPCSHKDHT